MLALPPTAFYGKNMDTIFAILCWQFHLFLDFSLHKMNLEFWYFLLEGQYDDNTGVFGNFFAHGTHCGEALNFAFEAARIDNFINPCVVEAERLDIIPEYVPPDDLVVVTDRASMKPNAHTFPLNENDRQFVPPKGIVKSTNDGEQDYSMIEEGFLAYAKNEQGIFEFELVAGIDNLVETYMQAIQALPEVELFCFYLQEHWEKGTEELWASSTITDNNGVLAFLTKYRENTLENGYVKCVVQKGYGSTLTLDDHKKIQFRTSDESLFNEFGKTMMALGFKQLEALYDLEFGYYHWHYRPFGSLSRTRFVDLLRAERFDRLDHSSEQ